MQSAMRLFVSKKIMKWLAMALAVLAVSDKTGMIAVKANPDKSSKDPLPESSSNTLETGNTKALASDQSHDTEHQVHNSYYDTHSSATAKAKSVFTSEQNLVDTFYLPLNKNLVLDPAFATDHESLNVLQNIYDTLVTFNAENKPVLEAAQSYQVSKDGKRWLFKLREDAKWTDGSPVTAYDFVYAWRRLVDSNIKSPNRYLLIQANILNSKEVARGEKPSDQLGVAALNDYELLVVLDKPTPWLLSVLASPATSPLKVASYINSDSSGVKLISNGAYEFAPDQNNDFLLVKNEHYWDKENVHISQIRSYGDKDSSEITPEFARRHRNIIYLNEHNEQDLEHLYPNQIETRIYPETRFLELNLNDRDLAKIKVRQAINLLIDRKKLIEEMNISAVPTTVFVPPVLREVGKVQQNEQVLDGETVDNFHKAIKLLKRSGYSKIHPLEIKYVYSLDNKEAKSYMFHKVITDMLAENSEGLIKIVYVGLKNDAYFTALKTGDFSIASLSWKSDYNHASSFYNLLSTDSGDNFSGYDSYQYNYLMSEAAKTQDAYKRVELYTQANNLLNKDLPIIPIMWKADRIITDTRLKNFAMNSYENLVKNLYFDKSNLATPTATSVALANAKTPDTNNATANQVSNNVQNALVFTVNAPISEVRKAMSSLQANDNLPLAGTETEVPEKLSN